jgi:hypothetical protein
MSANPFSLPRPDFRNLVNHALHPREEIDQPDQLKDRETELESLRDCFETPGAQAFIGATGIALRPLQNPLQRIVHDPPGRVELGYDVILGVRWAV